MSERIPLPRGARDAPGALWTLALVLSLGCKGENEPSTSAPTSTRAEPSAPPPAMSSTRRRAPPPPRAEARLCRALSVHGKIAFDQGGTLRAGDLLDGSPWLTLSKGSSVTVKHARTAREVTLEGPGKIRPCYAAEEHFLFSEGVATSVAGLGARPGAEVVFSTPIASIRYADAGLRLQVGPSKLSVEVRSGKAWLDGAGETQEVKKGERVTRASDGVDVKQLVQLCDSGADAYEKETRAALDRKLPRKGLGERAAANLRARRALRSACGSAAAALARVEDPAERQALAETLARAEARWRHLSRTPKPVNQ